jgi:hypothetical protein
MLPPWLVSTNWTADLPHKHHTYDFPYNTRHTDTTPVRVACTSSMASHALLCVNQMRTVLSKLQLASLMPSGLGHTLLMSLVWPYL